MIFAIFYPKFPNWSKERCRITYRERLGNISPVCGDGVGMARVICSAVVLAVLAVVPARLASAALSIKQPRDQMLIVGSRERRRVIDCIKI